MSDKRLAVHMAPGLALQVNLQRRRRVSFLTAFRTVFTDKEILLTVFWATSSLFPSTQQERKACAEG